MVSLTSCTYQLYDYGIGLWVGFSFLMLRKYMINNKLNGKYNNN